MDGDHAAMLRAVAKNTNDELVRRAYADFLMERNSPGWIIVLNYPIRQWHVEDCLWSGPPHPVYDWRLPWLEGSVRADPRITHYKQKFKYILNTYADRVSVVGLTIADVWRQLQDKPYDTFLLTKLAELLEKGGHTTAAEHVDRLLREVRKVGPEKLAAHRNGSRRGASVSTVGVVMRRILIKKAVYDAVPELRLKAQFEAD